MRTEIRCEKMIVWDFESCHDCKRFRVRRGKGLNNWGCAHNESTTKERRDFGMVWATAYLQDKGYTITIPEVKVIYIGKKRKQHSQ